MQRRAATRSRSLRGKLLLLGGKTSDYHGSFLSRRTRAAVTATFSQGWLARTGRERLSSAVARPAWHRPQHARKLSNARSLVYAASDGGLPKVVSSRHDRPGCGMHPSRVDRRRRALERSRPKLRRILHHDVFVGRAGGQGGCPYRRASPRCFTLPTRFTGIPIGRSRRRIDSITTATRTTWNACRRSRAYPDQHDVRLPNGGRLSRRRFQQLGNAFGASDGFERVHYMLEDAFVTGGAGLEMNYSFLLAVKNANNFESNPIYAVLHEACYTQRTASHWSAERIRAEFPEFDGRPASRVFHRRDDLPLDVRRGTCICNP